MRKNKKGGTPTYFALAETKEKIHLETIRPISEIAAYLLQFLGDKFIVYISVFYPTRYFDGKIKVKYLVFLDEKKTPRRFSKMKKMEELDKYMTFTLDLSIQEK